MAVLLIDSAHGPGGAMAAMGIRRTGKLGPAPWQAGIEEQQLKAMWHTTLVRAEGSSLVLQGPGGAQRVAAGALIVAAGGLEPTRGGRMIPGTRPAGIMTAGAALRLLTATGRLPGTLAVVAGAGRWAGNVAMQLDLAGVSVSMITPRIRAIEGWPRIQAVVIDRGSRARCNLLVLSEATEPRALPTLSAASIPIAYAGAAALGECDAEQAAAHGARVAQLILSR